MQYLLHYMQYCGGYEPKNCIAGIDVPLLHVYDNDKTWTWIYVCKGITWIEHPVSLTDFKQMIHIFRLHWLQSSWIKLQLFTGATKTTLTLFNKIWKITFMY